MFRRKMHESIKLIYDSAVSAVNGQNLIQSNLRLDRNVLFVKDRSIPIKNNVNLIGFGKAVLGMAEEIEKMFLPKRIKGILSVPCGTVDILKPQFAKNSQIEIRECARNNLPDESSCQNAELIQNFLRDCAEDDVVLVLISGGGSACLSSPKSPLTLEEKLNTIKLLVKAGADIKELNKVRKKMSAVKGGKLAEIGYPSTLVSLIISDIVGDPLQDIASGPTVQSEDLRSTAMDIVVKYGLETMISTNMRTILSQNTPVQSEKYFENVHNLIIGNNKAALESAQRRAEGLGFRSIVLSSGIEGYGPDVCRNYIDLVQYIVQTRNNLILEADGKNDIDGNHLHTILSDWHPDGNVISELVNTIHRMDKLKLCVICGGEITWNMNDATVIGKGGRNLHLTLLFQYEVCKLFAHEPPAGGKLYDVYFSSAGTDGIDGLTDVAGSIAHNYEQVDLDEIKRHLDTFDSFNYYKDKMEQVIKPGHTGTNVMDIHVLLIEEK